MVVEPEGHLFSNKLKHEVNNKNFMVEALVFTGREGKVLVFIKEVVLVLLNLRKRYLKRL